MPVNPAIFAGPARNYTRDSKGEPVITRKKYIVIHNTSNPRDASARDESTYARNRPDGVSSHYYADRIGVLQSLDTDWRAQHVGSKPGNDHGISYEITGRNSYTREWWLTNVNWGILAAQMAADCRNHQIEPHTLTIADIKSGTVTGFITHDQARQAWGGTDHTDPGPNFPMDHLLTLVRAHLAPAPPPPPPPPAPEPPAPPVPPIVTPPPAPEPPLPPVPQPPAPPVTPTPPDCVVPPPPPLPESAVPENLPIRTILSMLWKALNKR